MKRVAGKRKQDEARVEIARIFRESLRLESLPEYRNGERLLEHALAGIVRLTQSEVATVALAACEWLIGYSNTLRAQDKAGEADVIGELRALYRKALPESSEGLVEEVQEPEGQGGRKKRT